MSELEFKKYFKFPLHAVNDFMINTNDGHRAFDLLVKLKSSQLGKMLTLLNDENAVIPIKIPHKYGYSNGMMNVDGKRFLNIRGWGMLTGVGSYNLDADDAIRIQDEFAEYIINRLKCNEKCDKGQSCNTD